MFINMYFVACLLLFVFQRGHSHPPESLRDYAHLRLRNFEEVHVLLSQPVTWRRGISVRISFSAFGRDFALQMHEHYRPAIASGFEAYSLHSDGSRRFLFLDASRFLSGTVANEPGSYFTLFVEDDGRFSGTVYSHGENFYLQPLVLSSKLNNASLANHLMYKLDDVDFADFERHSGLRRAAYKSFTGSSNYSSSNLSTIINGSRTTVGNESQSESRFQFLFTSAQSLMAGKHDRSRLSLNSTKDKRSGRGRVKRDAPNKNTCRLLLVTDYTFCRQFGRGNPTLTANFLISMMSRVDHIYRSTSFEGLTYLGFEVRTVYVNCDPTPTVNNSGSAILHYNMLVGAHTFLAPEFLVTFATSSEFEFNKYCLAHLFSARQFNGVYGLGMIPSSQSVPDGGICSESMNVAWSTHIDMNGVPMLSARSDVLVGHEIGHNWGAQHDPITAECSPSNNRFMMYAYAMPGYDTNNKQFSPCSLGSIFAVLTAKSDWCFVPRSTSYCGNSVIEQDEQCDAGYWGIQGLDPCCGSDCKLKPGATCSDANAVCCLNCQPAASSVHCYDNGISKSFDNQMCVGPSHCTGAPSIECVRGNPIRDGQPCLDQGTCKAGLCTPFCESLGLKSCACSSSDVSCLRCCLDANNPSGQCTPWANVSVGSTAFTPVLDYQPCTLGYCLNGQCQQQVAKLTDRLWAFLTTLSVNKAVQFMNNNIVGTVIVFSLVIWLPVSIIIACIDKHNYEDDMKKACSIAASRVTAVPSEAGSAGHSSVTQTPSQVRSSQTNQPPQITAKTDLNQSNANPLNQPMARPLRSAPNVPPVDYSGPAIPRVDYPRLSLGSNLGSSNEAYFSQNSIV